MIFTPAPSGSFPAFPSQKESDIQTIYRMFSWKLCLQRSLIHCEWRSVNWWSIECSWANKHGGCPAGSRTLPAVGCGCHNAIDAGWCQQNSSAWPVQEHAAVSAAAPKDLFHWPFCASLFLQQVFPCRELVQRQWWNHLFIPSMTKDQWCHLMTVFDGRLLHWAGVMLGV